MTELPIPDWLFPGLLASFVVSLTFPLALVLVVSRRGRPRRLGYYLLWTWMVVSGLVFAIAGVASGPMIVLAFIGWTFPLAILVALAYRKSADRTVRMLTLSWLAVSAVPWVLAPFRGMGIS